MGILMTSCIAAGTLVVGGIITWVKKKEDLRQEKLERIIREVDNKVEEQPMAATLEEMTVDVDQAIMDLGIDEDEVEEDSETEVKTKEKWENWKEEVQKAVEQKNWYKMENLFHQKYFPYPADTSAASLFGDALSDGVITEELYEEAEKHYGRLWNYVGD